MIELSIKIRKYFDEGKDYIDLPGFPTFPKNSCEGAALFLGAILNKRFPLNSILYVKGEDENGSIHYWIESDSLIYDITADQFKQIRSPIFGGNNQPLIKLFPKLTKAPIVDALKKSDVTTPVYKETMLMNIDYYLNEHT